MLKRSGNQPQLRAEWLREVASAYLDAREAIPMASILGDRIAEKDLFTIAPEVTIKFRGLRRTPSRVQKATEAALSSYVANEERHSKTLRNPQVSFAFAYLASHFGLDLLEEEEVDDLMIYIEEHESDLDAIVQEQIKTQGDGRA